MRAADDAAYFDNYRDYRAPTHPVVRAYATPKIGLLRAEIPMGVDSRVLDVGCGNGVFTYWLSKLWTPTVGVDVSLPMLQRGGDGRYVCADAIALPFADDSFDVVFEANLLHHVDDPVAIAVEMKRVSRSHVVFVEPNGRNLSMLALSLMVPAERRGVRFSPAHLRKVIVVAGLHLRSQVVCGMVTQNRTPEFAVPALRFFDTPGRGGGLPDRYRHGHTATRQEERAMRLSIVIPALNEEEAVGGTLSRAIAARPGIMAAGVESVEIILVSDGSTDRTVEIARSFEPEVRVEVFERNRGYGAAIKHGFDVATGDLVAFMDADGTCDPEQFAPQVRELLREEADICCGSRMGPESQMPRIRRVGNRIFRTIVNALAGSKLTDVASGMRVIRKASLPAIYPMPDGLHFTPAMSCRAALDPALKIVEVPMPYAERVGRSKLGVLRDGVRFLRVICDIGLTYRPSRFLGLPGALLCLLALGYGGGLVADYARVRYIPEWMIYRMVAVTAFASAGLALVLTGILAERMVALLNGRPPRRSRFMTIVDRLARPAVAVGTAAVLLAAGLYANRTTIAEYFTERHIYVHWSFVVFGLFATVLAFNLLCFAAMDYLLALFPEQMSRLRRATVRPQAAETQP